MEESRLQVIIYIGLGYQEPVAQVRFRPCRHLRRVRMPQDMLHGKGMHPIRCNHQIGGDHTPVCEHNRRRFGILISSAPPTSASLKKKIAKIKRLT